MVTTAAYLDKVGFSATLKSKELINRMKAAGKEVLAFTVGEPDFNTPKHISEAAIQALNEGFTHYTASSGIPELRKAVARLRHRTDVIQACFGHAGLITC